MPVATDYHVHVYFETTTRPTAKIVVSGLVETFDLIAGTFHDQPVGPHPTGSCQLIVSLDKLGAVIDWLAINRKGLTIFTHANTGDVVKDHTDHTIWMGQMMMLDIDMLRRFVRSQNS